ncbi:MAG: hypothetical protein N2648_01110 [Aquificaceae bacterium]|nr:hypothetical protein [Aquificaceae bacterium]MCS7196526.1 hypothetical protein [Aquificaceae bacterium]MCX7989227.1 hypothetical protein [Aquificaceae bacterium]
MYVDNDGNKDNIASTVNLYNNSFSGNANFTSGQSEDLFITLVQPNKYNQGNNIQGDPRFMNASAGDFRLQAGSPCIDKGHNSPLRGLPQVDKAGNPRVVGSVVDIGTYEFQRAN